MTREQYIIAIADKLSECARKAWSDEGFQERYESAAGKVLDALHKRPDGQYCIGSFAMTFLIASSMGVTMREGLDNRYHRIQRELLAELIRRFPVFPECSKSISAYLNALLQNSPDRFIGVAENAQTFEEQKAKAYSFWSLMWLAHQLSMGMVKSEAMGPVVMPCAEFLPEFDLFLRKCLTEMFGEGKETRTPISGPAKSGCLIPLILLLSGVSGLVMGLSLMVMM